MAMNNIYYRFTHLASAPDYKTLPARLRMNVIGKPGVDKVDFELWCLAVSAINGCGVCIDSHEKILRDAGLTAEQIQTAVRIAATVHGVAATLDGEDHSTDIAINAVAA
jgi:alkyl hydroperoxide reductase subunit D